MIRFGVPGLLGILLFFFWVWCVLDVIATDNALCRNLPKTTWLIVVLILPDVGGLAWVLLGRPERAGYRPGDTNYRQPLGMDRPVRGPDDDPDWIRGRAGAVTPPAPDLQAWEDDLARREAALDEAERRRREERRRGEAGGDPTA